MRYKKIPNTYVDELYLKNFNPSRFTQGVRAMAAVPLLIDQQQGVLYICFNKPHIFTEDEINWVKLLANRAVDAIRYATYYTEKRDSARRLANLHDAAASIVSNPAIAMCELLLRITGNTLNIMTADLVILYEYIELEKRFPSLPTIRGRLKYPYEMMRLPIEGESPSAWLVESGKDLYEEYAEQNPIFCKPNKKNSKEEMNFVIREGIKSVAAIILRTGVETVGVMFINYRRHHVFSMEERTNIHILASTAAIAIQNHRLLAKLQENFMVMAHQMQAPLLAVIGRASSIRESTSREKIHHYVRQIQDLADDAWILSKGLLHALAREANLEYHLDTESIDVIEELPKICDRLKYKSFRNLKFEYNVISQLGNSQDHLKLLIDRIIFTNVIYSLADNAVKYADVNSTVFFTIDLQADLQELVLKVRSTGIPIDPREKDRVFERSYRGTNIEKSGRPGVGLGLWIAKQLMLIIGGDLRLELFPDQPQFSEFIAYFPR